jgi:NADPH:quinone reductase-like Zn-dependent oxidoreductase
LENGLGGGYDLPLLPGSDFAGTVIEVGVEVTRFRPDDRVILRSWFEVLTCSSLGAKPIN